jgi:ribonuclease HI
LASDHGSIWFGFLLRYDARLQFIVETNKCSNNIAEYEGVLLGLRKLRAIVVQNYILKIDSKVIASQAEKDCMARDATLERYLAIITRMENYFKGFTFEYVERTKNTEVDEPAKTAATRNIVLQPDVFFQTIEEPTVKIVKPEPRMVNII